MVESYEKVLIAVVKLVDEAIIAGNIKFRIAQPCCWDWS
jgi:hypothetical protein